MKIYRIAISGMGGYSEEEFYSCLSLAETKFNELIERKKKDESTLSDEDCQATHEQEHNFTELKRYPFVKESHWRKIIKDVAWSWGHMSGGEESEFYSYTEELILEEIQVDEV